MPLSQTAEPLIENIDHPFVALSAPSPIPRDGALLLITSEDCLPETFISGKHAGVLGMFTSPHATQPGQNMLVQAFAKGAVHDAVARSSNTNDTVSSAQDWTAAIIDMTQKAGTNQVITPWASIGPIATQLDAAKNVLQQNGIHLHQQQRAYDSLTWPHATNDLTRITKAFQARHIGWNLHKAGLAGSNWLNNLAIPASLQ